MDIDNENEQNLNDFDNITIAESHTYYNDKCNDDEKEKHHNHHKSNKIYKILASNNPLIIIMVFITNPNKLSTIISFEEIL